MQQKFISELMKQNYNDLRTINIFKLGILLFLKEKKFNFGSIEIVELQKYIYRVIIDNPSLASESTNVMVQNIKKYEPSDLNGFIIHTLDEWIKDGSGILQVHNNSLVNSYSFNNKEIENLVKVVDMILVRYLNKTIKYEVDIVNDLNRLLEIEESLSKKELLNFLNETRYKNRALENIKYCLCCDEPNIDYLYAVPIVLSNNKENLIKNLLLKDNFLVFCEKHYTLFSLQYFCFDENGIIKIFKMHPMLDNRMRIPRKYLTEERKTHFNNVSYNVLNK